MTARRAVLITGGAGYIGSHAVLAFREAGHEVIVLDDLSTGYRALVPQDVPFVEGGVGDSDVVEALIDGHGIGTVVHFAGSIIVPESVTDPLKYYRNNTCASRALIEACVRRGVSEFIFSSTAAVYGEPAAVPVPESAPLCPTNPYGSSKLAVEWMLRDASAAHGLKYAALRYFNVAGADPEYRTGQLSPDATHLIKRASQVVAGALDCLDIFGQDYDTPDGTCIRDYIHVSDLAAAHVDVLETLRAGGEPHLILNCGYGHGFSVREVLTAMERVSGYPITTRDAPRRAGDPMRLVADSTAILAATAWRPRHDDLAFIVRTAIEWERRMGRSEDGAE